MTQPDVIGASLSEPHTSVHLARAPAGNNVCMYVCIFVDIP